VEEGDRRGSVALQPAIFPVRIDLTLSRNTPLIPLLDSVPLHQRVGAIIKGERDLPARARTYSWFEDIAEPAGIPADVWNMDARAGGASEAEEVGATVKMIQGALTHTKESTTLRYIRRRSEKITGAVADPRSAHRATENDGGTG
jgi:hypothetical protein